jgi:hypothetical protein
MEAFPDEGDIDMVRALVAYRDVGYPYMLMPDHAADRRPRPLPASPSPIATATSRPCSMRSCRGRMVGVPDRFAAAGYSGHPQGSPARAV